MPIEKRTLSNVPGSAWKLVYDTDQCELYVESGVDGTERISIDKALKMKGEGANGLHLAIVDLFK
jgi:hypothetical protein